MDFTIIIPAYNVEAFIGETTLNSIVKNNIDNTEIIVIDDGSTDNTKEAAVEFLKKAKVPNYKVISQDNDGVSVARNVGIEYSSGKYIIFCDGDDYVDAKLINKLNSVKDYDSDMYVWRFYTEQNGSWNVSQKEFDSTVIMNKDALKKFLLEENRIRIGSFAVKRELLEAHDISFTEGCSIAEDIEFIYKCLAKASSVYVMNDILYTYVKREGSAMHTYNINKFQAPKAVERVYDYVAKNTDLLKDSDLDNYLKNGLYVLHTIFAFDACITHLKDGDMSKKFLNQYFSEYKDVEEKLDKALKNMKIAPKIISGKKMALFKQSRKLYVSLYRTVLK